MLPPRSIRSAGMTHTARCVCIISALTDRFNWIISKSWFTTSWPTCKPLYTEARVVLFTSRSKRPWYELWTWLKAWTLEVYYARPQSINNKCCRSDEHKYNPSKINCILVLLLLLLLLFSPATGHNTKPAVSNSDSLTHISLTFS